MDTATSGWILTAHVANNLGQAKAGHPLQDRDIGILTLIAIACLVDSGTCTPR